MFVKIWIDFFLFLMAETMLYFIKPPLLFFSVEPIFQAFFQLGRDRWLSSGQWDAVTFRSHSYEISRMFLHFVSPGLLTVSTETRRGSWGLGRWWSHWRKRPETLNGCVELSPLLISLSCNMGQKKALTVLYPWDLGDVWYSSQLSWLICFPFLPLFYGVPLTSHKDTV